MSHIFGLPHTVTGVLGGVGDFLGGIADFGGTGGGNPINFGVGGATGGPNTLPVVGGGSVVANPCPGQKYEIVTTVNPDGTTSTVTKKKTRRRRRRLATVSDIRDLAALKSILGGGKVFEAWIATRGR